MSDINSAPEMAGDGYFVADTNISVPNVVYFSVAKHVFDKSIALVCMPVLISLTVIVAVLNVFLNPGPVFYTQTRMGKHGKPFVMWKFRSMLPEDGFKRCHTEGVELHRITPFGGFMRKYRIDELPNLFNVLKSEMSIVGPRPDLWDHAVAYCALIPAYRARHLVRPGITGLAQVDMGYAQGVDATAEKALYDHRYIHGYGFRQELRILFKTVRVILTGSGAL